MHTIYIKIDIIYQKRYTICKRTHIHSPRHTDTHTHVQNCILYRAPYGTIWCVCIYTVYIYIHIYIYVYIYIYMYVHNAHNVTAVRDIPWRSTLWRRRWDFSSRSSLYRDYAGIWDWCPGFWGRHPGFHIQTVAETMSSRGNSRSE